MSTEATIGTRAQAQALGRGRRQQTIGCGGGGLGAAGVLVSPPCSMARPYCYRQLGELGAPRRNRDGDPVLSLDLMGSVLVSGHADHGIRLWDLLS